MTKQEKFMKAALRLAHKAADEGEVPVGAGSAVLDLEDFLVSNIWLPLGSLVYLLFCTTRYGWGWKNFQEEANEGGGLKIRNWMRFYVSYILPLIVIALFVLGVKDKFFP